MFQPLVFFGLVACGTEQFDPDIIRLQWNDGDQFHVSSTTRIIVEKGEETPVDMLSLDSIGGEIFEERWTADVIWTYDVVHTDHYPDSDDDLYEYAINGTGEQVPLSVLKVSLDPMLNTDPQLIEMDPVIYLVFRQERNRLAGIIEFINVDGARTEKAYSTKKLNRSYSHLSQSRLSMAPTYLAPFGARWSGSERVLENGKTMSSEMMRSDITDVFFDDLMGGELISARYERGQPWPTWVVTENMSAHIVSEEEIDEMRGFVAQSPNSPEEFDYRAALQAGINLDRATSFDQDTIENLGYTAAVDEQYRPWAGAWWPLKKGELVFGYEYDRDTFSKLIQDKIDPIKKEMDELSAEIRKMDDRYSDEANEKRSEYRKKQIEVHELLTDFYNEIQRDFDGGKIRIEDGRLRKDADTTTNEDGDEVEVPEWNYDINKLSPMDKFALTEYLNGNSTDNPFYLSSWEILNSYNPGGDSWWGHCNGWAAAAILTNEPTESQTIEAGGHEIEFSTADLKGLLTEAHYSTSSQFYGERYNGEEQDVSDLSPEHFHKLVTFYLKEQGVPFVFDTTAKEAVWNYPAWKVEIEMEENGVVENPDKININSADIEGLMTLKGIDEEKAKSIIEWRENNGEFQRGRQITEVISWWDYLFLRNDITHLPDERKYNVVATVTLTTDGVDADHIDSGDEPESLKKVWGYTLVTNGKYEITGGEWDDEEEHPDFAWVPYHNPRYTSNGNSENPHLNYGHLLDTFGDEIERR